MQCGLLRIHYAHLIFNLEINLFLLYFYNSIKFIYLENHIFSLCLSSFQFSATFLFSVSIDSNFIFIFYLVFKVTTLTFLKSKREKKKIIYRINSCFFNVIFTFFFSIYFFYLICSHIRQFGEFFWIEKWHKKK